MAKTNCPVETPPRCSYKCEDPNAELYLELPGCIAEAVPGQVLYIRGRACFSDPNIWLLYRFSRLRVVNEKCRVLWEGPGPDWPSRYPWKCADIEVAIPVPAQPGLYNFYVEAWVQSRLGGEDWCGVRAQVGVIVRSGPTPSPSPAPSNILRYLRLLLVGACMGAGLGLLGLTVLTLVRKRPRVHHVWPPSPEASYPWHTAQPPG